MSLSSPDDKRNATLRNIISQGQAQSQAQSQAPAPESGKKIGLRGSLVVLLGCALASALFSGAWRFLWDWGRSAGSPGEGLTVATYYLRATTESLSFDPVPSLDHGWVLPPGAFTVMPDDDARGCATAPRPDDSVCRVPTAGETVLAVRGSARVRLDATGTGLAITVLPAGPEGFTATVTDLAGNLVQTRTLLTFETISANGGMRLPLILAQATLGSSLYENVTLSADGVDSWQPQLLDGSYAVVAGVGNRQGRESFTVLEGTLGPGDVVSLGRSCGMAASGSAPADDGRQEGALRGVASVPPLDGASRPVISVSLNACVPVSLWSRKLPAITVQRFGGTAPSTLAMPSLAVVLGRWPQWISFWVTLLAAMGLVQFFTGIAGYAPQKPAPAAAPRPEVRRRLRRRRDRRPD